MGNNSSPAGSTIRRNGWFATHWDVDTGRALDSLAIGQGGFRSVAFSPDGATIAVGGESGRTASVTLFETATGNVRRRIPFADATLIRSVAFSSDGKTLAASGNSTIRLFDTGTGHERIKIDGKAVGLRFSPNGSILVGAIAGTIYRWDAATGKSLIPKGGDSPVAQIAVTADGKRVISLGEVGDGHVWDARTGEHLRRMEMSFQQGFALSPDGRFLVWPMADESIQFKRPGDPNTIYTGSRLQMLDLETGTMIDRFGGFEGNPYDLFFTLDGKSLVTVDHWRSDANVRIWNFTAGKTERSFPAEWKQGSRVSALAPVAGRHGAGGAVSGCDARPFDGIGGEALGRGHRQGSRQADAVVVRSRRDDVHTGCQDDGGRGVAVRNADPVPGHFDGAGAR